MARWSNFCWDVPMIFSSRRLWLPLLIAPLLLSGCGGGKTEQSFPDTEHDKLYKNGSVLSEQGGISLLDIGGGREKKSENYGLGVNGFLWRAALDTIAFMPLASADPFGGVIITDWYTSPSAENERVKINVYIMGRELRADGIKVTVFRQQRTKLLKGGEEWRDAPVDAVTSGSLEDAILTRARQLRIAQMKAP